MAEPMSAADQAMKKLNDQLECPICLEYFTNPKLLQCFHVFCKDCLEPLMQQTEQHGLLLRCPTCRCSTHPPATGVSGLQSAFHIHHLFEIRDALQKVKQGQEGQKTQCEKCKKREAKGFCHDCGKLICEACIVVHQTWEEFSTHKVISLEQLKSKATEMVPLATKTFYCSKHPEKELDLFCETDQELICRDCIVKTHRDHQYDFVSEAFPKHQYFIATQLNLVRQQLITATKGIADLDTVISEVVCQKATIEVEIRMKIDQLHKALEVKNAELIHQLGKIAHPKLEPLSGNCVGSKGMKVVTEKPVVQEVEETWTEFRHPLQEQADLVFTFDYDVLLACQKFGQVYISQVCPRNCYVTGKGLKVAIVGKQNTLTVHVIDTQGSKCANLLPLSTISCELEDFLSEKIQLDYRQTKSSEFEVTYRPICRGTYKLHIKVLDEHIKSSPFSITARGPLIQLITALKGPEGVVVNNKGQIIIAERDGCRISIYSGSKKVQSFGKIGSAPGQFLSPCSVAVDRAGNILVVDAGKNCILKFTADGAFLSSVGGLSDKSCQFNNPNGIAIHPKDNVYYVCDCNNHRIQILNSDLSSSIIFGSKGSGDGAQFQYPRDVAFDSQENMYVADSGNHRIQVFRNDGRFLRTICMGKRGGSDEEMKSPTSIAIDSNDVLYIADESGISFFTGHGQGHFVRLFRGMSQIRGLTVDEYGILYVTSRYKNCLSFSEYR